MNRNLDVAMEQMVALILRQLGEMALDQPPPSPTGQRLAVLSQRNVWNLAANIVGALDEFGRTDWTD